MACCCDIALQPPGRIELAEQAGSTAAHVLLWLGRQLLLPIHINHRVEALTLMWNWGMALYEELEISVRLDCCEVVTAG